MPRRFAVHAVPWPVIAALVVSTVIVLGSAYISRQNIEKVSSSTEDVMRTGELLDAVTRLRSLLLAVETGQRGYLLTGSKEYLGSNARASPQIKELMQEMRTLSAGRERQQRRVAAVEPLVAGRLAEVHSTIEAMERGDRAAAQRIVESGRGLEVMEALLAILFEIRAEEVQLRAVYKDLVRHQSRLSELSEFITAALVLLQIALCYGLLLRYLRERRAAEATLAALNARLDEEVRDRTDELQQLSRYLMSVREEEKSRIARELHDEMGSGLTAVNMDMMSVRQRLGEDPLAQRLGRAAETLKATVEGMRRIIEDLRPTMLESLGLREAVRSWSKDAAERAGVALTIDIPDELPPLPAGSPIGLFRIVQEALTNALRHAKAKSIRLSLRVDEDKVVLEVVDDGVGIAPRAAGSPKRHAHGLLGIRERAMAMGGTCTVGGAPGGRGTEVRVTVPVAKVRAAPVQAA